MTNAKSKVRNCHDGKQINQMYHNRNVIKDKFQIPNTSHRCT